MICHSVEAQPDTRSYSEAGWARWDLPVSGWGQANPGISQSEGAVVRCFSRWRALSLSLPDSLLLPDSAMVASPSIQEGLPA